MAWPWCPRSAGSAVWWEQHDAEPRQLPDLGEADRALRAEILGAADDAGPARRRAVAAGAGRRVPRPARRPAELTGPAGIPAPAVALAGRALRGLRIAELGLADDGGAATAPRSRPRRDVLVAAGAGRRVAPWSPPAPPRCGRPAERRQSLWNTPSTVPAGSANVKRRPPG